LFLLALAAGVLSLLARAGLGWPDQQRLTESWLLAALDQSIDEEVAKTRRCLEAKRQVARALIDGRLTPQQAAAQVRNLNADLPDKVRRWRPPEYTEEEWTYRQVIDYVHLELTAAQRVPAQAQEWVSRLEAEFREYRRNVSAPCHGRTVTGRGSASCCYPAARERGHGAGTPSNRQAMQEK
jgi:hypothetical protein